MAALEQTDPFLQANQHLERLDKEFKEFIELASLIADAPALICLSASKKQWLTFGAQQSFDT